MKLILTTLFISLIQLSAFAQDDLTKLMNDSQPKTHEKVSATFKTTRLNMAHSIETVGEGLLDIRISHVFGAMGSAYNGTKHNLYGFDIASNIRLALEYGINSNLTFGFGRSKGFGSVTELYDGYLKYRLLKQTSDNHVPVSITLFVGSSLSGMKASSDPTSEASFTKLSQRVSYASQLLIARKFNCNFSAQVMPTIIHRNYVAYGDENDLFAIGAGARWKFAKRSAVIVDYFYPFSKYRQALNKDATSTVKYYNPLGIGYELETGGHVFHVSVVNTGGFTEQDFICYSPTSWTKMGIRLGFNISRGVHVGTLMAKKS